MLKLNVSRAGMSILSMLVISSCGLFFKKSSDDSGPSGPPSENSETPTPIPEPPPVDTTLVPQGSLKPQSIEELASLIIPSDFAPIEATDQELAAAIERANTHMESFNTPQINAFRDPGRIRNDIQSDLSGLEIKTGGACQAIYNGLFTVQRNLVYQDQDFQRPIGLLKDGFKEVTSKVNEYSTLRTKAPSAYAFAKFAYNEIYFSEVMQYETEKTRYFGISSQGIAMAIVERFKAPDWKDQQQKHCVLWYDLSLNKLNQVCSTASWNEETALHVISTVTHQEEYILGNWSRQIKSNTKDPLVLESEEIIRQTSDLTAAMTQTFSEDFKKERNSFSNVFLPQYSHLTTNIMLQLTDTTVTQCLLDQPKTEN
ncbi:MAG: hypothetical protein NT027_03955 [Proteobacteria bacterium]|nr:hypothetical protein [Pseudomonadota bacterium]